MKPPIPYFGGKITAAPRIVAALPPHGHYVEPFAGSLAVLLAKRPSDYETVNDIDGALMTFWRVLRDQPMDLARVCALTPHSRAEHASSYEPADSDIEVARRVWVGLTQGRMGIRRATGWRHYVKPVDTAAMPAYLLGYLDRVAPAAERLRNVSLEHRPASDVIEKYGAHEHVLLYVDPPYLASTRSSGGYLHEMQTDDQHIQLAEQLRRCAAAVVISGYRSDLYDSLYEGWTSLDFAASTGQGIEWGNRTEVLWSNRPLNAQGVLDFGDAS